MRPQAQSPEPPLMERNPEFWFVRKQVLLTSLSLHHLFILLIKELKTQSKVRLKIKIQMISYTRSKLEKVKAFVYCLGTSLG